MPEDTILEARHKALKNHLRAKVAYADEIAEMDESFNIYHGEGIWSAADKAKLKREKRPILNINLVKPALNLILGIERDTQQMMRVWAEHSEDVLMAAALDSIGNRCWYDIQGADLRAEMFGSGTIAGRGHLMLYPEVLNGTTQIKAIEVDPREAYPDPDSRNYDPDKDASFFSLERYFAPADLEAMFPDYMEEIKALHQEITGQMPMGEYARGAHKRLPGEDYLRDPRMHYDLSRDRLEVIEQYTRRAANEYRLTDPVTGYHEDFKTRSDAEGEHDDAIRIMPDIGRRMYVERITATKMDKIVIIGGEIVPEDHFGEQEGPPELGFPIVTYRCHHFGGRTTGVARDLIDPARQYNKTYSNLLNILTSVANSGWYEPVQANLPDKFLEQHGSESPLVIKYRAPFKPEKITPQSPATAHLIDMDMGPKMIDRISGAVDPLKGIAPPNVESGYGIERLQNYGLAVLGITYGNLLRSERSFYNKLLIMNMTFLPVPDEVEILGNRMARRLEEMTEEGMMVDAGDQKFLRLTALGGLNRMKNLKYRVRTERGPVLRTQREYWLSVALQISQFLPPGSVPPELLVEMVDHPEAQRILDSIKEQRQAAMMQQGMEGGVSLAQTVQGAAQ